MAIKQLVKRSAGWLYLNTPRPAAPLRGAGVILMLHRVLADDTSARLAHRTELCIGPQAFEHLLRWLKRHFDCVPLMDLLTAPVRAARPRVALTFDDGWRDNAINAFPLLQHHQVPASIFLSTDFIGSRQCFWWESVGETLWGSFGAQARQNLIEHLYGIGRPVPVALLDSATEPQRSQALAQYLQSLKAMSAQGLSQLADACPAQGTPQALDWQQVRQLEDSGLVRFGPHGASHAILTGLDDEQLEHELRRSHEALLRGCRQPLPVYCYPNGNHDTRVRERVAAHRYPYALGTRAGVWRGAHDPLALPRIGVSQHTAHHPSLLAWRMYQGARP